MLQAPWELLANDNGYLAGDVLLRFAPARRLGAAQPATSLDDYRLGIGFMAAAPEGVKELDYEAEEAAILSAVREVDLFVEDSGDPDELGHRLSTFDSPLPVLHLSCHGHNAWKAAPASPPQPALMLEGVQGGERPTTGAALVEALGSYRPRLMMLSACLSAAADERGGTGPVSDSLASTLVRAGLPAVLGWDGLVADTAATQFARELYDHLGQRQSIVEAAASARRALLLGTSATGATGVKDGSEAAGLGQQLVSQQVASRRDWHLARVWLGPDGGGAVVRGARKRSMLPHNYEYKQLLAVKGDAQLAVASAAMFVGRRRELQKALRVLAGSDYAGVLLHGMGRAGKSSLAARIASRRRDLRLAVVYEDYDALSILEVITEALQDHAAARTLLDGYVAKVRSDPAVLRDALVDLLAGPCREAAAGKPLLLLIDDLERVLEPGGEEVRQVRPAERAALGAVLQAFDPARSDSRLLITSRFPFSLVDDGVELAGKLLPLHLAPFQETAQRKLSLRQLAAARTRPEPGLALDEAVVSRRLPLLERAQRLARGNPGLQDLLGDRLVLRSGIPDARVSAVLEQTEAYLAGGALPEGQEVREFLQKLALDQLLEEAGATGQALLRALLLFELPVPQGVVDALAAQVGGRRDTLLALGLLDPFPDLVDRAGTAVAVNALVAGRLKPLAAEEKSALVPFALPVLFEAWGAHERRRQRPYVCDIELTRLGLLAKDAKVIACCAADAVRGLEGASRPRDAAAMGQACITVLEQAGQEPPLALLAHSAATLSTIGEGAAATDVLRKGEGRVGDSVREIGQDPSELVRFLFELGNRRQTLGDLNGARAAFGQAGKLAASIHDEHSFAVTQGQIADILFARGELEEALRIRREEELPVYTRLGAVREIAVIQGRIAQILAVRGDLDGALELQTSRLATNRKLEDKDGVAAALWDIAQIEITQGKTEQAVPHLDEAWRLLLQLGRAEGIAVVGELFGQLLARAGLKDNAREILRRSAEAYRKLGRTVEAQEVDELLAQLSP